VIASGCASQPPTPYPADWPSRATSGDCAEISGRYRNEATNTTLWRSPTVPATARAYLANLLSDGTSGSVSSVQAAIQDVVIDAATTSYRVSSLSETKVDAGIPSGHWTCLSDGRIAIRFERKVYSEDSEGNAVTVIELQRASDQSLIVRKEVRITSITFGVIPNGSETVDWARFAPVAGE
jgi:hypothetical protein